MAWIPFGQLWCEIRLTHHRRAARRAIPFLAAFAVFCAATVAALIWAFGGIGANLRTLAAAIAAAGALYCRIRLLALEFHSLRDYMDDPPIWKICLIFSFFGFPIQRIYLFINRNELD